MALDAQKVAIGAPEQTTTGAIYSGDIVTGNSIPNTFEAAEALLSNMTASGYVSEDGLEMSVDISTEDIREWGQSVVRRVLSESVQEINWSLIQMDEASWKQALGDDHVTKVAATTTHGEQLHIKMGAHMPEAKSWAFTMKDGDFRMIVFVPNGQITSMDSVNFAATEAIALPVTLTCYNDGTGETVHVFIDDGKKTS